MICLNILNIMFMLYLYNLHLCDIKSFPLEAEVITFA